MLGLFFFIHGYFQHFVFIVNTKGGFHNDMALPQTIICMLNFTCVMDSCWYEYVLTSIHPQNATEQDRKGFLWEWWRGTGAQQSASDRPAAAQGTALWDGEYSAQAQWSLPQNHTWQHQRLYIRQERKVSTIGCELLQLSICSWQVYSLLDGISKIFNEHG